MTDLVHRWNVHDVKLRSVTCVNNFDGELSLTVGRDYEAELLLEWNIVLLTNDRGVRQTYHRDHFELDAENDR